MLDMKTKRKPKTQQEIGVDVHNIRPRGGRESRALGRGKKSNAVGSRASLVAIDESEGYLGSGCPTTIPSGIGGVFPGAVKAREEKVD